jgi:hypothetical protein
MAVGVPAPSAPKVVVFVEVLRSSKVLIPVLVRMKAAEVSVPGLPI